MPTHRGSIEWTEGLPRQIAATVAQFLTGHYATSCYLHRFHLVSLLVAPSVELPKMTTSTASSSALTSSTRARLWRTRSSRLPMVPRTRARTTCFVTAGHTWPGSLGACERPQSHWLWRRIRRAMRTRLRVFGGCSWGLRSVLCFLRFFWHG